MSQTPRGPLGGAANDAGRRAAAGAGLLDVFDRIYVINLAHRADRRREMAAQLARIGLGFDHPRVTLFPARAFEEAGPFPSRGARGCFMSHLDVLRAHRASGEARALVLEDDADFAPDAADRFPVVAAGLGRARWDMVFGVRRMEAADPAMAAEGLVVVPPTLSIETSHALGITRPLAEAAIPYLEAILARPAGDPAGGPMHVDGAYSRLRRDVPALVTLATIEPLAVQRSSRSDIAALRLYDRLPLVRSIAAMARRALR